jgi:hypothetical protein
MADTESQLVRHVKLKLDSIFKFGDYNASQEINENRNNVEAITIYPSNVGQETLFRKVIHQPVRVLGSGADLVIAPSRWMGRIQENWYEFYNKMKSEPLWQPSRCGNRAVVATEPLWHLLLHSETCSKLRNKY